MLYHVKAEEKSIQKLLAIFMAIFKLHFKKWVTMHITWVDFERYLH